MDALANALLAVAALTFVWAVDVLRRIAAVGASYKAKALASAYFVSGLDIDPESAPEVSAEAYTVMRLFKARVDRAAKTVTVSCFGLQPRTAVWRAGLGAALALRPLPPAPAMPLPKKAAPLPVKLEKKLQSLAEAALDELPGRPPRRTRAIVILRNGAVAAEAYGAGISATTPLNGWSMTKSVTAALIGTLVGQGKLSLPQDKLLAQWRTAGDPRGEITLEDLLRMRSGLRFEEVYADPLSDVNRMLFAEPDAASFAASRPLAAKPGTVWKYASGTTNILSLIARRTLGEAAYPAWPRTALFDAAGMESAVFETDASGTFVGSSFLFATARDWARFGQVYADGGRGILPAGWTEFCAMPTPQSTDLRYGAQWWLKLSKELGGGTPAADKLPKDALHALGHEGQCVTVIPSKGLVIARLGLSIDVTAWDQAAFCAAVLDA